MRHELPGGQWVELLDIEKITNRQRKNLLRASTGRNTDLDAYDQVDIYAAALITGWSLPLPLPTRANTPGTDDAPSPLDDLDVPTADAIYKACLDFVQELTASPEPSPDPASPTSPSGA